MIVKARGPDELLDRAEPMEQDRLATEGPDLEHLDPGLALYLRASRLKRLFRQGWLKRGIEPELCESVAEHSFGVALLALLLAPEFPGLDRERAAMLALCHELGEAYAGDITPVDGIGKEEKHRLEKASLERVLGGHEEARFFLELWEEFEEAASPEARFVKELDRLEMGIQAAVYKAEGSGRMEEFFDSARRALSSGRLKALLEEAIAAAGR